MSGAPQPDGGPGGSASTAPAAEQQDRGNRDTWFHREILVQKHEDNLVPPLNPARKEWLRTVAGKEGFHTEIMTERNAARQRSQSLGDRIGVIRVYFY